MPLPANGPTLIGNRIQCPRCGHIAELITVTKASHVASVSRRTIYNYIEEGRVSIVRIAGKTSRICSACLLQADIGPEP